MIERYIRQNIAHSRIPSQEDVEGRRADQLFDTLKETLDSGAYSPHGEYIERLLDQGHAATDIAGALITMLRQATGREAERIVEDKGEDEEDAADAAPDSDKEADS